MARLESETGLPFMEFIKREQGFGVSLAGIARSVDVHKDTLYHWVRKMR
jgi:transposase-like protein